MTSANLSHAWLREVRDHPTLSPNARLVAGLSLFTRMRADGHIEKRFTPALDTIASDCGWKSRKVVIAALEELITAGFLLKTSGGGHKVRNRYRAISPTRTHQPQTDPADTTDEVDQADQADQADQVSDVAAQPVAPVAPAAPAPASSPVSAPVNAPAPAAQHPAQAAPTAYTVEDREAAGLIGSRVCALLPPEEQHRLAATLNPTNLGSYDKLIATLGRLHRAGHTENLVEHLSQPLFPGSTPYGGVENPARVFATRTFEYAKNLKRRAARQATTHLPAAQAAPQHEVPDRFAATLAALTHA